MSYNSRNQVIRLVQQVVPLTASKTLTGTHAGSTITLDALAGLTVTLPEAKGTGTVFNLVVTTTVTSNSYIIQVANSSDTMQGLATLAQDAANTVVAFETAATSDTVTMNGSTTGGLLGTMITLTDVATNKWQINLVGAATGTEATPFSAAV